MPILYPKRFDDVKKIRILNLGFGTGALSGFLCSKLNTKYEEKIDIESVEYSDQCAMRFLRNSGILEFRVFQTKSYTNARQSASSKKNWNDFLKQNPFHLALVVSFSTATTVKATFQNGAWKNLSFKTSTIR